MQDYGEVIIMKNDKEVGLLIPHINIESYITDSLTGILKGQIDINQAREEGLRDKYEISDLWKYDSLSSLKENG